MQLFLGDCLEILKTLESNSVDAIVTDPPAGIAFMGKEWDKNKGGRRQWIEWMTQVAEECLRVIKPGGHALVWAIPRTSHWTGTAWEDAGWECRDKLYHCFGSGFPKSLAIGKAIDKMAGAEREVVGIKKKTPSYKEGWSYGNSSQTYDHPITAPATPDAQQWEGWGTALKPAIEEWWLFRKPISEPNIAANVLRWGTGGLNIEGCRVEHSEHSTFEAKRHKQHFGASKGNAVYNGGWNRISDEIPNGRFPAQLIHDGSDAVLSLFPETSSGENKPRSAAKSQQSCYGTFNQANINHFSASSGSAARFFKSCPDNDTEDAEIRRLIYQGKATKRDRDEGLEGFEKKMETMNSYTEPSEGRNADKNGGVKANTHPTVKPVALMRYLCRLITPPNGIVLDPFMGSGSTGKGAILEGFQFIGIEQNFEYLEIAKARILFCKNKRSDMGSQLSLL